MVVHYRDLIEFAIGTVVEVSIHVVNLHFLLAGLGTPHIGWVLPLGQIPGEIDAHSFVSVSHVDYWVPGHPGILSQSYDMSPARVLYFYAKFLLTVGSNLIMGILNRENNQ